MTMRFASSTLRTVNGVNSVGLAMCLTRDLVEERLEQSPLEHAARSADDGRPLGLADDRRDHVRYGGGGRLARLQPRRHRHCNRHRVGVPAGWWRTAIDNAAYR